MIDGEEVAREFERRFGRPPRVHRAPGRVNLIGEHTDYNDGFVMPMALDRATWVAAAPREDRRLIVHSGAFCETASFDLDDDPAAVVPVWGRYIVGVAALVESRGADLLIASDVPIGAGLSSSAALEVACASALAELGGRALDAMSVARLCQRAEHEYAGVRCGIMDQTIACCGRAGHALLLDTRSLQQTLVPVPETVRVMICNTMVSHALASAEYNARRADCEAAVAALAARKPGVRALRDVSLDDLDDARDALPPRVWRRCRHVVTENDRVIRTAAAFAAGDFDAVGALMEASHTSLRDDYQVSCPELDMMAEIVSNLDGVYGARMTGGGFGGSVVALADAAAVTPLLIETIRGRYQAQTRITPDVWACAAGDGVSTWSPARV